MLNLSLGSSHYETFEVSTSQQQTTTTTTLFPKLNFKADEQQKIETDNIVRYTEDERKTILHE